MFKSTWTLQSALTTTRTLEVLVSQHGWHAALGGGVMKTGTSSKDLDLILFPHSTENIERNIAHYATLQTALKMSGWALFRDVVEMHRHWRAIGSYDQKHVQVWEDHKCRRVDMIWMFR